MLTRRAVLIQCISEYLGLIDPYLTVILLHQNSPYLRKKKEMIRWIITEEIELIYGLFARDHDHENVHCSIIHSLLNFSLPASLSRITSNYIKAPEIYCDNVVNIKLTERDLYIEYYADVEDQFINYGHRLK